jgi:hypothetical protein
MNDDLFDSGVWNVPFISEAYLINGSLLKGYESNQIENRFSPSFYSSHYPQMDADMTFCNIMRDNGVFMFITNLEEFGHLVSSSTFDTTRKHADFYEIYSNQKDWQNRYIHENYSQVLSPQFKIQQPCPDVYWFPVVTPTFCKHLIGLSIIKTKLIKYYLCSIYSSYRNNGKFWPMVCRTKLCNILFCVIIITIVITIRKISIE